MGAITRRRKFLNGRHRRYCVRPACQEGERSIQERAARPGFEPSRAGGLRPRHPCRLFWSAATSSHWPNKAAWFMSQFPDRAGPGNWYRRFVSELIPGPAGIDVLASGGFTTRHNQTWRPICCFAGVCCRSPRLRNERRAPGASGSRPAASLRRNLARTQPDNNWASSANGSWKRVYSKMDPRSGTISGVRWRYGHLRREQRVPGAAGASPRCPTAPKLITSPAG
jgi:hypothetical protein